MSRKSNIHPGAQSRKDRKKRFYGNYLGIVVQNNDPEQRGRIKVYIPHVNAKVYSNWDNLQEGNQYKDKKFKSLGKNVAPELANIIDSIKVNLPWAECAAPLMGESGSGRYNAKMSLSTISDSGRLETCEPIKQGTDEYKDVNTKYKLNDEGLGESPGYKYEVGLPLEDGFSKTTSSTAGGPVNINKFSSQWKPSTYSNKCKGIFSVPNVGSHVWVWHEKGDPLKPVYFAVSHGREDWQGIHECSKDGSHGIDSPGTYENKTDADDPTYNHNTETYRNKFVFNQKGGAIEICNTDNRELLALTHYSGSFKQFGNHTTKELAVHNHEVFVLDDQFLTVKGTRNEMCDEEYDLIVKGDHYRKVGTFNRKKFIEWQAVMREFANLKQAFELRRCNYTESEIGDFQFQSPLEVREGTFSKCPLCSHESRQKMWDTDNQAIGTLSIPTIDSSGDTVYGSYVSPTGDYPGGAFNNTQPTGGASDFLNGGACPLCLNTPGLSPSSLNGVWAENIKVVDTGQNASKEQLIWQKSDQISDLLVPIEKELGLGGSEFLHVTKHKVETIGLIMNDFPCIRVDPVGRLEYSRVLIRPGGVVTMMETVPLIEEVHVDGLPGGDYTLNVCNKYNVQVGAGGVSFKSTGNMEIGGAMVTVAGEQVNLASQNEINIHGKRVSIVADILSLRQKNYKQVLVDSSLGVSNNLVVGGGAHIEGELTVNHITAPEEIQETEQTKLYAKGVSGIKIGECVVTGGSSAGTYSVYGTNAAEDSILCYDHSHQFKNVPLHLMATSDDVRKVGMNCTELEDGTQSTDKIAAKPVENKCKGGGLLGKGESI